MTLLRPARDLAATLSTGTGSLRWHEEQRSSDKGVSVCCIDKVLMLRSLLARMSLPAPGAAHTCLGRPCAECSWFAYRQVRSACVSSAIHCCSPNASVRRQFVRAVQA